jgi:basic membrane protein A
MATTVRRIVTFAAAGLLVLTGCSGGSDTSPGAGSTKTALRIKFVINGTLGDKSFFDSANAGLEKIHNELGYQLDIVELGSDRTKWEPGFEDAASSDDYDIFVAGTFDSVDFVSKLAPEYPEKKFWLFDAPADYAGANGGCSNKCSNVYSVQFKQNEGGYLAGYLSAQAVDEKLLPGVETRRKVGVIGAAEIPVIKDFLVGFDAGFAAGGGTSAQIITQYVGGNKPFGDPARGKEIATSMYGQGAALVWPVAGSSGFGVFEAAVADKAYTIGIDSDQFETLTDAGQKQTVITSILKNVGAALYDAATKDATGSLPYGTSSSVGLKEDAVGYVDNARFRELVPETTRGRIADQVKKITAGAVAVPSAF